MGNFVHFLSRIHEARSIIHYMHLAMIWIHWMNTNTKVLSNNGLKLLSLWLKIPCQLADFLRNLNLCSSSRNLTNIMVTKIHGIISACLTSLQNCSYPKRLSFLIKQTTNITGNTQQLSGNAVKYILYYFNKIAK